MDRDQDLALCIRQRDIGAVFRLMFEGDEPVVRGSFRTEGALWDFKSDCPRPGKKHENAWAVMAKDVLGFHNADGGVLVYGISDDYAFVGATTRLDSKLVNDGLRRYLGDRIWVEFHRPFIRSDQRYLGIAVIPPRGHSVERFKSDAPLVGGKRLFSTGESAIREGDSTRVLRAAEAEEFSRRLVAPAVGQVYLVDEPYFRILTPPYQSFVERARPCEEVEAGLANPRTAVTSVLGIGGVGKTALATWAALRAFKRGDFDAIVSITAKDRELTSSGILPIEPTLTSFDSLLDGILEVMGVPEFKANKTEEKEVAARDALTMGKTLIYVDNLETVDDARIIRFLDSLPGGVQGLVTSRRTRVRVSVYPVDVSPITEDAEAEQFVRSVAKERSDSFAASLTDSDCVQLCTACDGIPLAVKWVVSRSSSPEEVLGSAEEITQAGRKGEELLEFCFRRIFDGMPGDEKAILERCLAHESSVMMLQR